ncbi:MAG: sigma-70 family RNA polymerase sigma factor [Lachnospiraceae bacterium]|jgi:RNA polymerase sporulation-specific sigma factor|nr:sigma-70 family RNA polymerase sigma factor [Lachnospiraceae bacterium]SDW07376.1 RNA polymerase, sigma 30 subunit, SigH [Lachnospiraceae bacterium KHCPX20]
MPDYSTFDEARLIQLAKEKDAQAIQGLLSRYQSKILQLALSYYLLTGDHEDLAQEGRLGFLTAIEDYDEKKGSFSTFAMVCVRRAMYRAISSAARKKHEPLNESISFYEDGGEEIVNASAEGFRMNPETALLDQEKTQELIEALCKELSGFEQDVFDLMLEGADYKDIAEKLQITLKQADNAIQRIRSKARKLQKKGIL